MAQNPAAIKNLPTLGQLKRQAQRIRQMECRELEERLAAENAALRERVRLAAFGKDVIQALVQSDMLAHLAAAMGGHLHGAFARIWIRNPGEGALELQASAGPYTHPTSPHSRVPVEQVKIGAIAREGKPHLMNAVVDDPRVGDPEWAKRERMVALTGYPLVVDDAMNGGNP